MKENAEVRIRVAATNIERGLYQCSDDWQGSWTCALEHESVLEEWRAQKIVDKTVESKLSKDYACPDQWQGSLQEALAHKKKLVSTTVIIEAINGSFRGTFENAAEWKTNHMQNRQAVLDEWLRLTDSKKYSSSELYDVYQSEGGFRGTWEEVVAHERETGHWAPTAAEKCRFMDFLKLHDLSRYAVPLMHQGIETAWQVKKADKRSLQKVEELKPEHVDFFLALESLPEDEMPQPPTAEVLGQKDIYEAPDG